MARSQTLVVLEVSPKQRRTARQFAKLWNCKQWQANNRLFAAGARYTTQLRDLAKVWMGFARGLEAESVRPGGNIRQSGESKQARAQVLRSCAQEIFDLLGGATE